MKLIIQIPCYNEAETLEITLNELPPPSIFQSKTADIINR